MSDRIAIDQVRDIVVAPTGGHVTVSLRTYKIPAMLQPLTPDQAEAIANALLRSAAAARATVQASS